MDATLITKARRLAAARNLRERTCPLCHGEGTETFPVDQPMNRRSEGPCRTCRGYGMLFYWHSGVVGWDVDELVANPPGSAPIPT